ncbi:ankyrin repeat domain-containing protein 7-like [Mytilus edulis]|uniref:ankyrin repeat domain-containing protein 7-like n=1 Tax=Mytilus edulis TaxID=6550 RepID=UPI0039EEF2FB
MNISPAVSTWSLRSWSTPILKRKKKSLTQKIVIIPKKKVSTDSSVGSIDKVDSEGRSLLFYAATFGTVEVADQLLKSGCDPNVQDVNGDTALHEAVLNGHLKLIRLLLKKAVNLDINVKNGQGETPLMVAVHQDQIDVVKHLHKAGASIHETDHIGRSALLIASEQGSEKCCQYLMKHGVDMQMRDSLGHSALFYALHSTKLSVQLIKQILKSGYDVSLDAEWVISENHSENSLKKLNPKLYQTILDKIGVPHFERDCYCRRPSIGNVILTRISTILVAPN